MGALTPTLCRRHLRLWGPGPGPLCSPAWRCLTGRFWKGAHRSHLAGAPLRGLAVLQLLVGDTGVCPTPLPEKRQSLSGPSVLGSENRGTPQCFPSQHPWTPGDRGEAERLALLSHPGVSSARSAVPKWGLRGAQDSRGLCSRLPASELGAGRRLPTRTRNCQGHVLEGHYEQ